MFSYQCKRKIGRRVGSSHHHTVIAPVAQLSGKYKEFDIDSKQGLLDWINSEDGWMPEDLLEVIRDWNAEQQERIEFSDLEDTDANGFIEENDPAFIVEEIVVDEEESDVDEYQQEEKSSKKKNRGK